MSNWPVQNDASDFFSQSQRQASIEKRRPALTNPRDILGPNGGAIPRRVTTYNDGQALITGSMSSTPGAAGAPNSSGSFVVTVVGDPEIGGYQMATEMLTGTVYHRTFTRVLGSTVTAPTWTAWRRVSLI